MTTFAVERIRQAELLSDRFDYPARYDAAKHTEGTFGIMDGEETCVDLRILNGDTAAPSRSYLRPPARRAA